MLSPLRGFVAYLIVGLALTVCLRLTIGRLGGSWWDDLRLAFVVWTTLLGVVISLWALALWTIGIL